MVDSERDYSGEIADICKQHHVKYLGLHGSSVISQEDAVGEELEINFLVEFLPLEPKQQALCYFGLEKELADFFGRKVGLCNLTGITHPGLLGPLTRRKTDIYQA